MRSHSKTARPGKRYIVVSHASPVPSRTTPPPTPTLNVSVFQISSRSCVCQRCDQISRLGVTRDETTTRMGVATTSATAPAASGHGSHGSLRAGCPVTGTAALACRVGMPGLRYLYPTRSMSFTASAWSAPAAATSTLSALNAPQAAMNACGFAPPLAGYS